MVGCEASLQFQWRPYLCVTATRRTALCVCARARRHAHARHTCVIHVMHDHDHVPHACRVHVAAMIVPRHHGPAHSYVCVRIRRQLLAARTVAYTDRVSLPHGHAHVQAPSTPHPRAPWLSIRSCGAGQLPCTPGVPRARRLRCTAPGMHTGTHAVMYERRATFFQ